MPSRGLTREAKLRISNVKWRRSSRGGFDLVQTHERLLTANIFRAGDGVHAAWLARLAAEQGSFRAMAEP